MINMYSLLIIIFIFSSIQHKAFSAQPQQIERVAKKLLWQDSRGQELNTLTIQSQVGGMIRSLKNENGVLNSENLDSANESFSIESNQNISNDITMTYEAFIRPDRDGIFQLLPLPMFYLQMEKERDSIYICAELSGNQSKTKAVIFFMKYGRPIVPKPLPLNPIKKLFWKLFHKTPLVIVDLPFYLADKIQEKTFNLIGILTKVGVDRIRIDGNSVELYTGGDPTQFNNYLYRKTIKMKE